MGPRLKAGDDGVGNGAATPSNVITGLDPVTHSPRHRPKRQGIVPAADAGRDSGFPLRVRCLRHPPMGPRLKAGDDEVGSGAA